MYLNLEENRGHNIFNYPNFNENLKNHTKYADIKYVETQYGKLFEKKIGNRQYIIHEHNSMFEKL